MEHRGLGDRGGDEFISELKADAPGKNEDVRVRVTLGFFDRRGDPNPVGSGSPTAPDGPAAGAGRLPAARLDALNDAVIQTIASTQKRVRDGDRVMIVVLTDGLENASEASTRECAS